MTDQQDEWGPIIQHDGNYAPHLAGEFIVALHFSRDKGLRWGFPKITSGMGRSWCWRNSAKFTQIVAYRIRKPRGLTLLQQIAQDVSEPEVVGHE